MTLELQTGMKQAWGNNTCQLKQACMIYIDEDFQGEPLTSPKLALN